MCPAAAPSSILGVIPAAAQPTRTQRARIDLELPCDPSCGRLARQAIDGLAGELHPETFAKLRLLVTELVVAALTPVETRPLRLVVDVADGHVRTELSPVADDDTLALSRPPRGYGVFLVNRIADRRGSLSRTGGLWFELKSRPRKGGRASRSTPPVEGTVGGFPRRRTIET